MTTAVFLQKSTTNRVYCIRLLYSASHRPITFVGMTPSVGYLGENCENNSLRRKPKTFCNSI